jgi:excisionase family DNA binding protein
MSPQKLKKLGRPLGSKQKKPTRAPADMDESAVMTLQEVADYLHCVYYTAWKLAIQGKIPCFKLGGEWRVLKSELDKWIAKGGNLQ